MLIFCLKVAAFTPLPFFIFLSFVLTLYPRLSNYTKPYFSLISSHSIAYMMMAISPLDNLLFKNSALFFTTVEPKAGFEPTTCSLQMSCSTNWAILAYTQFSLKLEKSRFNRFLVLFTMITSPALGLILPEYCSHNAFAGLICSKYRIRTYDLRIMSPTSWPLL